MLLEHLKRTGTRRNITRAHDDQVLNKYRNFENRIFFNERIVVLCFTHFGVRPRMSSSKESIVYIEVCIMGTGIWSTSWFHANFSTAYCYYYTYNMHTTFVDHCSVGPLLLLLLLLLFRPRMDSKTKWQL